MIIRCYLCQEKNIVTAFFKSGYSILRCQKCGLHFLNFQRNYNKFLTEFYGQGYFQGDKRYSGYVDYTKDKRFVMASVRPILMEALCLLQQQNKHKKNKQHESVFNLFDIGCATGFLMEEAEHIGFKAYGIDPSAYAIAIAKKKFGQRAQHMSLDNLKSEKKEYNVISMFDVFEHLKDPRKNLLFLHSILASQGILLIKTGDQGSFIARLLGSRWHFYNPPQHLFFMNLKHINNLLIQTGFQIIKIKRVGRWFSMLYILHIARTSGNSRLAEYIYRLIEKTPFANVPVYLRLNDNIVVFAKKSL